MTHGKAEHVEILIDAGAAMLLAGAVSYALLQAASGLGLGASVAALSFAGSFYALRAVRPEERAFALPEIASVPRYEATADILELTEADRWQPEPANEGELLLDTEIAHFGPGSRVVRLFEPAHPDLLLEAHTEVRGVTGLAARRINPVTKPERVKTVGRTRPCRRAKCKPQAALEGRQLQLGVLVNFRGVTAGVECPTRAGTSAAEPRTVAGQPARMSL